MLSFLPADIRLIIAESIFRMPSILSKPLREWIEKFSPDVIYSITATAPMLLTVVKVSRWRNIPIVPYFTDDWVTSLYKGSLLNGLLRKSMQYWFDECLRRSPVRLTPCGAMNEEYEKRYGGTFVPIMYPVERGDLPNRKPLRDPGHPIRFVFIGSLEPNRWRSLRAVGEALFKLRSAGISGELLVYTYTEEITRHRADLTLEPVLRIMGTATPDDILRLQQDADILVHAESFDSESRIYTKYSLSTKIPQYMMAGACIFAYGPGELASVRYIKDLDAGLVVSERGEAALSCALRRLILDRGLRLRYGDNARRAGIQRHDAEAQRKRFREIMTSAKEHWISGK
jgi:glycosyltransferase involved in cell wall biosynthesis